MKTIRKYEPGHIKLCQETACYEFTQGGDVYRFVREDCMVNRVLGNCLDGGGSNLWLRVYDKEEIKTAPLLGGKSGSSLERSANCLRYTGCFCGVSYTVVFHGHTDGWIWEVRLSGKEQTVDVVYGMDAGMGTEGAVLDNDLYICQYLGHTIGKQEHGYVICSRQNLPQNGKNPFLQLGMLEGKAVAYSTDEMQFFGKEYKFTNKPKALTGDLDSCNYQFEAAYPALQSERLCLGEPCRLLFYGFVREDHPEAVEHPFEENILKEHLPLWEEESFCTVTAPRLKECFKEPFCSEPLEQGQLDAVYPARTLCEEKDGKTVSFFGADYSHIILQEKELLVERPHANILTTFINTEAVDSELITTTCGIYGLFNGQTVIGNTNCHKLLSAPRGLLNRIKSSGMRIWVEWEGGYRLLAMPAVFETGLNYCRWIYLADGKRITVETFAVAHSTDLITRVYGEREYRYIVTCQLVMGTHEHRQPVVEEKEGNKLVFRPAAGTSAACVYPELNYEIFLPESCETGDDRIFYEDGESRDGTLLTVCIPKRKEFSIRIHGTLEEKTAKPFSGETDLQRERKEYLACYTKLLQGFYLEGESEKIAALNTAAYWFAHNALVHFAAPHGLEQPGGAAWGTRDVCQGPFEFFLASGQYSLLRSILLKIFANQHQESGEWAQWFMFDRYPEEMDGCHGDVVFWPLKCMGDYLDATEDVSILTEEIPFKGKENQSSVREHLEAALNAIEARFLPGTALISYAGGDWDDTLQPCSPEMQKRLVSSWTQALACQVLEGLGRAPGLEDELSERCKELARRIKEDFFKYLVQDGIIAGFVYRLEDGRFEPMLHPNDRCTGIHYRLLPMTRSIIAGLSDPAMAADSLTVIEEKLHCPDGVRLMDHPARYGGGVSRLFKRAEQAANIGREISMQYTHAHIRYIEALCKMGRKEAAWKGLFEINPVNVCDEVKNALPRQRNMYFSSSDGNFFDRWIYGKEYRRLWEGDIAVKGGWRLYSSGPGIYFRQLLCGVLGIRVKKETVEIDPVLPKEADGLRLHLTIKGKKYIFSYHIRKDEGDIRVMQEGERLPVSALANPYRKGGVRIALEEIRPDRTVEIFGI